MIGGLLFLIMRGIQLVTLIPLIGMLAYIVHGYVQDQYFLPNYVLVLFIVSVIAGVWALVTTIFYRSVRKSGHFLALVEIGIFAALIAGVVILRGIAGANCSDASSFNGYPQLYPFYSQWHHVCTILKACFALGIMNILFFFVTFFLAIWVHHHYRKQHPEYSSRYERRVTHSSRHGHRRSGSRSTAPRESYRYDDRRSSGGSRRHSSRRSYV